jgi:hypothetical protein
MDSDQRAARIFGAILLIITNIGTAVVLFPIARRYSETLALSWAAGAA